MTNQDTTSIDKILKKLGIWFKPHSVTFVGKIPETEDERPQILDISYALLGILISDQVAKAYRKGYNDNARDCYCRQSIPENLAPHKHLLDDGESHDIRPDIAQLRSTPND